METTYFALGVLSMVAVMFITVIVVGLIKVMRMEKNLKDLTTETRDQFGEMYRITDSNRTDFYRELNETRENMFRSMDDRVSECRKYTDKRVDKTLNLKED